MSVAVGANMQKNPEHYVTPFERGFDKALKMWLDGYTIASITHHFDGASEYDRGGTAATYALEGWLDLARREARMHGISRGEIERLINSVQSSKYQSNPRRKHRSPPARKKTDVWERLIDRNGNIWLVVPNSPFVEDPEFGERYTREYVESKFGPLKPEIIMQQNPRRRLSKKCQGIVSRVAASEQRKGVPQKQAVAIGYSKARRAGCRVPGPPRRLEENPVSFWGKFSV